MEPLVKELTEIIEATNWDYKSEFKDLLRIRDKALVSLPLLFGLRISEALVLKFSRVVFAKSFLELCFLRFLK
jgi:site-specific recombinase XerD